LAPRPAEADLIMRGRGPPGRRERRPAGAANLENGNHRATRINRPSNRRQASPNAPGAGRGCAMTAGIACDTAPAPRGAIPNWQPATTLADYLRNLDEGLEEYSERRMSSLLGWPRVRLQRAKLMAEIPDGLFEHLLARGVLSSKALANVALAFRRAGRFSGDIERCPHCHAVLRVREHVTPAVRDAIHAWLAEGAP